MTSDTITVKANAESQPRTLLMQDRTKKENDVNEEKKIVVVNTFTSGIRMGSSVVL